MGVEDIAREYIEAFNLRRFDRIEELASDDVEVVDLDGSTSRGKQAARRSAEFYTTAFPDATVTIDKIVTAGDTVLAEMTGRGTNDGPFGDTPATHRKVEMQFCEVLTIEGGKITSDHLYGDTATMMRQLGLLPEPAHA